MALALSYIQNNPGCCIADVAKRITNYPRGWRVMYPVVWRLRRAGLVTIIGMGNRYSVTAIEA